MRTDDPPEIVGPADQDPDTFVRISARDDRELLTNTRRAAASGLAPLVAPDEFADERDEWIALAAAAIVEGAVALETRRAKDARRLLDMHRAIVTGGSELAP